MTGPGFQDVIPETNWMFPAGKTDKPLNPAFDKLVKPAKTLIFSPEEVAANRKAWVDEWLAAMSRVERTRLLRLAMQRRTPSARPPRILAGVARARRRSRC